MKLPNLENARVEQVKITDYLLSDEISGGKSAFFLAFGFTVEAWQIMKDALLQHAISNDVARSSQTPHGIKYIIEGEINTPDGRSPLIRTIWIVDTGTDFPRLVTAYPIERLLT